MLNEIPSNGPAFTVSTLRPKITWRLEKFRDRYDRSRNSSSALSLKSETLDGRKNENA